MKTIDDIKQIVEEIRIANSDNIYQTDLDETKKKIEEKYNYQIEIKEINENDINELMKFSEYSGSVQKENKNKYVIKINPFDYSLRKRFTIAHELGHIILQHFETNLLIFDPTENIIGRPYNPESATDHIFDKNSSQETQANQFAAELLMPKYLIKEYFDNMGDISMLEIENAMSKFKVSKSAMMVRLSSLNYRF